MKTIKILSVLLFVWSVGRAQVPVMDLNLENYDYFAPVHFMDLSVQKGIYTMAYMDIKPAAPNGKTVLLLHGKNFNGAYWHQVAHSLSGKGYRVLIPDQLGFGKSSKPSCFHYSFQQLASNTRHLLDSLKVDKAIVLGHSMGGMLAIRFALMFPDKVSKLILEDPIGLEDYKLKVPLQSIDQLYEKEMKQSYASLKKYEEENYYNNKWKPEYEEWLKPIAGWTKNENYTLIAWNNALTTDMILTQPVVYELSSLKMPVLLIIGAQDHTALGKDLVSKEVAATMGNYPALGEKTKKLIPSCELVKLEDTGHIPHIQSFEKFIVPVAVFIEK